MSSFLHFFYFYTYFFAELGFNIINIEIYGNIALKEEFMVVYFQKRNLLPSEYSQADYETKDFVESKLIQDFPIRGRAVYLKIKIPRWRYKQTEQIIKSQYQFASDSGKFTQELAQNKQSQISSRNLVKRRYNKRAISKKQIFTI